jgi:hypothetical protein
MSSHRDFLDALGERESGGDGDAVTIAVLTGRDRPTHDDIVVGWPARRGRPAAAGCAVLGASSTRSSVGEGISRAG